LSALAHNGYFKIVREAASPEELDQAIARGEVQFALTIPADFTRRVVRGDDAQILVEADASDPSPPRAGRSPPWPICRARRFPATWWAPPPGPARIRSKW
jgi:hypothetical protein